MQQMTHLNIVPLFSIGIVYLSHTDLNERFLCSFLVYLFQNFKERKIRKKENTQISSLSNNIIAFYTHHNRSTNAIPVNDEQSIWRSLNNSSPHIQRKQSILYGKLVLTIHVQHQNSVSERKRG